MLKEQEETADKDIKEESAEEVDEGSKKEKIVPKKPAGPVASAGRFGGRPQSGGGEAAGANLAGYRPRLGPRGTAHPQSYYTPCSLGALHISLPWRGRPSRVYNLNLQALAGAARAAGGRRRL
jgi:hypothetical protein